MDTTLLVLAILYGIIAVVIFVFHVLKADTAQQSIDALNRGGNPKSLRLLRAYVVSTLQAAMKQDKTNEQVRADLVASLESQRHEHLVKAKQSLLWGVHLLTRIIKRLSRPFKHDAQRQEKARKPYAEYY